MAFSSEIRYKIGGDVSGLNRAFVQAQSVAATAGQTIQKKFQGQNLFQGLMQGLGIGSVDTIANLVVAPFRAGAESARALVDLTSSLVENTYRWLGAVGGPTKELELQVRQVNDLNQAITQQRTLIADLNKNPLNLISEEGRGAIKTAEDGLNALILKQAELGTAAQIAALQENRRFENIRRQGQLQIDLANVELRRGTELEKTQLRLNDLKAQFITLQEQGALPSALLDNYRQQKLLEKQQELTNKESAQRRADLINQNRSEQKRSQQERAAGLAGLGQSIATGKNLPLRPRGRSEAERIADRGAGYVAEAEQAMKTGKSPDFVATLTRQANRDFTRAGGSVAAAGKNIGRDDSAGIKSELVTANGKLSEIIGCLQPVNIEAGGGGKNSGKSSGGSSGKSK
jgi:hypothetical protein